MNHGNPLLPPYEVRQGNCLQLLRDIPKNSIHCVVTSPPYFGGVRNYGTENQVWGGLSDCPHSWEEIFTPNPNAGGGLTPKQSTNAGSYSADPRGPTPTKWGEEYGCPAGTPRGRTSAICRICSAWKGELGSEPELWRYLANLGEICDEIHRVLRPDGTFWLNLGDVYASTGSGDAGGASQKRNQGASQRSSRIIPDGLKPKDLCLVPHRTAIMLQERGWWVRQDNVWGKGVDDDEEYSGSAMPNSVSDRSNHTHEYVFQLAKSERYFYDRYAVLHPETKRNQRSVWMISPKGFSGAHFATYPLEIPERCILAGTSAYGVCVECGAPWEPVVEKGEPDLERQRACGGDANGEYSSDGVKDYEGTGAQNGSTVKANTLKSQRKIARMTWQPTCLCGCAEVKPATVLDPFCGSGTTLITARRNGRIGIGLELLPENVEMSRQRIEVESLGRPMKFTKPRKGQPQLFDLQD